MQSYTSCRDRNWISKVSIKRRKLHRNVLQRIWGSDTPDPSAPATSLEKWLSLLPQPISDQIALALYQERPFMPPDVTPEMMAKPNQIVAPMNNIEIIYRCIDFAMKAGKYQMAAALIFVVDRACYRFGQSAALLHIVSQITKISQDTAIAPQVILRQARVMKDSGDLHTAMRILNAVITRERKWDYKNVEQYENTKAVCVQIKGQILHNLGLWKDAVPPLVESVRSFRVVSDNKGISSSLALLSRCLKKLEVPDYHNLQGYFPDMFETHHPFYEAYVKGIEAVKLIEDLGTTVYMAHNKLVADESLLMFTIQHADMSKKQKLDRFQVIVEQMKQSLAIHHTVQHMQSLEVYLVFVRAVFIISLTLHFSPVSQDADLARFLEKLSLELYAFMCQQMDASGNNQSSSSLRQDGYSVRRINGALVLLGLPILEGSSDVEKREPRKKWSEIAKTAEQSASVSDDSLSFEPKGSNSSENGSSFIHGQSVGLSPSMTELSKEKSNSVEGQTPAVKAGTFPAITPSKFHHGGRHPSSYQTKQKFVGLTMSTDDIIAATCPALRDSVADASGYDASQDVVDVESLVVSADYIASASASQQSKGISPATSQTSSVDVSKNKSSDTPTVDQSASTKSTSSGTTDSSEVSRSSSNKDSSSGSFSLADVLKNKSSDTPTVDQSASTKSTSPETTDSSEVSRSSSKKDSSLGLFSSADMLKNKSSDNPTVDQSASTKSTSSGTTDSSEVSRPSSNKDSSSGTTGVTSPILESCSSGKRNNSSATVDQLADTLPSSTTGTSDSDESNLSPLVDVSLACELMADLHLGSSVETSDSEEFLARFIPSDTKDVHRAVVMTYNPAAGQWSAQTTLAYVGPLLDTVTKGSHRDAIHVSFLHQDEPLGRYVGKRYRHGRRSPEVYMQDVVCQMLAGFYVTRFNQALQHCQLDILQVQFLSAAHLQLLDRDGRIFDWINVEPFLHGSFLKLTNNLRYVSKKEKDQRGVEVATALSHFSYAETHGALMMVDLQGWTPADGKGVVYLTDPVFHTSDMKKFSSGDRHQEGMQAFWTNQHPECNKICKFLGLDKTRPDTAAV